MILVLAAALALGGQGGPSPADLEAVNAAFKLSKEGQYMATVSKLESVAKNDKPDQPGIATEVLGWYYSFVGEYDRAMSMADGKAEPTEDASIPAAVEELEKASAQDAITEIVRQSRGRQIVILNEAHHVPRSRAFGLQLARALRKEGFDYFAAETFTPKATDAYKRKTPTRDLGFYSIEPFFGDLIRQTMRMGYRPVVYEADKVKQTTDTYERINDRETQESQNLNERWFKLHPKSRIFIYCGYSHATENWGKLPDGKELAWMAARLTKLTGIDPLTVDQTYEIPHSRPGAEMAEYRYAVAKGWLSKGPRVFRQGPGKYAVFGKGWKDRVDMQVFTPHDETVAGRPSWTLIGGYRKPVAVPAGVLPASGRVLVQAFTMDKADELPVDQVIATNGQSASLVLPRGLYRLVVQNEAGESKPAGEIRVR